MNSMVCSISDNIATRYGAGVGEDITALPVDIQMLMRGVGLFRLIKLFDQEKPHKDFPLVVKTHNANLIPNGVTMLPEQVTKATIHIVRDPRDVVISFAKHLGSDIDKTIEFMSDDLRVLNSTGDFKMNDFISSWKMHTKSFVEGDLINSKTFLYEDMTVRPVDTFSEMLTHMGIKPDKERVEQALKAVEISKLRAREKTDGFIEASKKNDQQFFGRGGSHWQDILKPYQVHRIEKMAGHYMQQFGYKGRLVA